MAASSLPSARVNTLERLPAAIGLPEPRRLDPAIVVFAAMAAAAVATLLWLGRDRTFVLDDFDFLGRQLTLADALRPHNEHLTALPLVAFRLLVDAFGTGSYLPFLSLLMVLHVAVAAAVMGLVGGRLGLLAAAVVLFLGSGYENLFWAFQIGFVGSVAAGLWAMRVERHALAAVLLGISLACSGIGLVFVVPVAVVRRRGAVWLIIPILGYLAWYAAFGDGPQDSSSIYGTAEWAVLGLGWAFGSFFHVGLAVGLGIAGAVVVLGRRADRLAAAALLALGAEYALIALARSGMDLTSFAAAPRYVYVAAPFIILALAGSIRDRRVVGLVLVMALAVNVAILPAGVAALS